MIRIVSIISIFIRIPPSCRLYGGFFTLLSARYRLASWPLIDSQQSAMLQFPHKGVVPLNNEEKILAILTQMQTDISDLKAGQAKLEAEAAEATERIRLRITDDVEFEG